MLLRKPDDIFLPNQWFPAGHDIGMDPEFLSLCDKAVHIFKGQVQRPGILGCPASRAVEVARACRIKEDDPRDPASILFCVSAGLPEAGKAPLKAKGHNQPLQVLQIRPFQQSVKIL